MRRILVAGAGAAGLAAAIAAARGGASVTVLEHKREPGIKLTLTGGGRGNFSNTDISPSYFHEGVAGFTASVLEGFDTAGIREFMESVGLPSKELHYPYDDRGYIYPVSERASDIRDRLYEAAMAHGVSFHFGVDAEKIEDIFANAYGTFDALILASGGNALRATGSDGSIYPLLRRLRIPFKTFYPALTMLYSHDEELCKKGRRVRGLVELLIDSEAVISEYGEIQLAGHHLSGIPVMNMSGEAGEALRNGRDVAIRIGSSIYPIYRTGSNEKSQVSRGGVDLNYVDPATLRCKCEQEVYAAGELLDVDGSCGGYNLHFAFSSGLRAGKAAAAG